MIILVGMSQTLNRKRGESDSEAEKGKVRNGYMLVEKCLLAERAVAGINFLVE